MDRKAAFRGPKSMVKTVFRIFGPEIKGDFQTEA